METQPNINKLYLNLTLSIADVFGPCFDFAKKWWDLRYNPNIYFNFYEDMNKVRALFNDDYDDIKVKVFGL